MEKKAMLFSTVCIFLILIFTSCVKRNHNDSSEKGKTLNQGPWKLDSINIFLLDGKRFGYVPMDSTGTSKSYYFSLNNGQLVLSRNKPGSSFDTSSVHGDYFEGGVTDRDSIVFKNKEISLFRRGGINFSGDRDSTPCWDKYTFRLR